MGLQEGGIQVSFLEFILGPGEGPLPCLVALTMHSSQRLITYYSHKVIVPFSRAQALHAGKKGPGTVQSPPSLSSPSV